MRDRLPFAASTTRGLFHKLRRLLSGRTQAEHAAGMRVSRDAIAQRETGKRLSREVAALAIGENTSPTCRLVTEHWELFSRLKGREQGHLAACFREYELGEPPRLEIPKANRALDWEEIGQKVQAFVRASFRDQIRNLGLDADAISQEAILRAMRDPRTGSAIDPTRYVCGYARRVAFEESRKARR